MSLIFSLLFFKGLTSIGGQNSNINLLASLFGHARYILQLDFNANWAGNEVEWTFFPKKVVSIPEDSCWSANKAIDLPWLKSLIKFLVPIKFFS